MKVVVIGNSGSGKSTYARRLSSEHGLAHLELDAIVWEPDRIAVLRPADQVRADLAGFLVSHDRWVIEGCYGDLAEHALADCSELIFMNPGLAVCLDNNRRRAWEPHKYKAADDQDRMLPDLLRWVEDYYQRAGPASHAFHRRVFDGFVGRKRELEDLAAL